MVARVTDFGAFVTLEAGVDGLVHISEMSWSKKLRRPSDLVKAGDNVEVVILGLNPGEKRISLGLKQTLGDPWADAESKYPVGKIIEAPVTNLANFGAFLDLGEGVEGMIHIGDITREKRLDHPKEALKTGQIVRAQVLEFDREKRRIRLGMKQLEPTTLDTYIAEHQTGETVTGRVVDVRPDKAESGTRGRRVRYLPHCERREGTAKATGAGRTEGECGRRHGYAIGTLEAGRWHSREGTER